MGCVFEEGTDWQMDYGNTLLGKSPCTTLRICPRRQAVPRLNTNRGLGMMAPQRGGGRLEAR